MKDSILATDGDDSVHLPNWVLGLQDNAVLDTEW